MLHILTDSLRNAILITGLVVVMMMMIESLNIESKGLFFRGLRKTKFGQVFIGALLGAIPGCMGGFATVSLYTHRMLSFGALVAMMIASSGDESFIMLAMIPEQAMVLFAILFVIAIVVGVVTDKIYDKRHAKACDKHHHEDCGIQTDCEGYKVHEDGCEHGHEHDLHENTDKHAHGRGKRHYGWRRICMFFGLAIFIAALATGKLGHDHAAHEGHDHAGHVHAEHTAHAHEAHVHAEHTAHAHEAHVHTEACDCGHEHEACGNEHEETAAAQAHGINLLSEDWMNVLFAGLSIIVLFVLLFASDHFVEEHLWKHIIRKHLPTIFAWTFGVLLALGIALQYIDIEHWISNNTVLMILLATLIGIIPESGPHMIFVTLFATGVVPFPVLLASSISQDGHASIPLLAESKKSFLWAKLINCAIALAAGYTAMIFM